MRLRTKQATIPAKEKPPTAVERELAEAKNLDWSATYVREALDSEDPQRIWTAACLAQGALEQTAWERRLNADLLRKYPR